MSEPVPRAGLHEGFIFALICFVLALIGLFADVFCCGFVFAIGSIVCGHIARHTMRREQQDNGRNFALAGLIISYLHLVVYALALTALTLLMIYGKK